MSLESEVRENTRKMNDLLEALRGNGGSLGNRRNQPEGDSNSFGGIFKNIGDGLLRTIDNAGQLVGKAYDNTATVSDATKSVSKILGEFGTAGTLAGSALQGIADIVVDAVENWQNFSNFGLQFGGNAIALNEAVKKTGLSFREYEEMLPRLTPAFANFGEGLNRGAETFGQLSNSILNDPAIQKQMNLLGLRTKDVNEALAIVSRGAGMIDANNRDAQMQGLIESAARLAKEMDIMSKLTGVSRKEQEKAIETMQNDERVRARIVMLRKQNPAAEASIGQIQQSAAVLDPATQKLLMESIAGKGIMSSDDIAEFQQVFGPEAAAKIAEIGRKATSENEEDRKQANLDTKELVFMLAKARENGAAFVAQGAVSNKFSQAAFQDPRYEILSKNLATYTAQFGETEARRRVKDEAEALGAGKLIQDLIDKDGKVIAKAGEDDPRRATTELVTNMNTEIKRFSTGLSEIITEINKAITLQRDTNGQFIMQQAAAKTSGYNEAMGGSTKDRINAIKIQIETAGSMPESWTKSIGDLMEKALKNALPGGLPKPPESRLIGSKKATGQWFESGPQNITIAEGTEREARVPESQMEEFVTDMAMMSSPGVSRPNLAGILRNIPSKISSAQSAPVEESQIAKQEDTQDKMIDKLGEISTVLAANLTELKSIASHARDTASNTKDMGGYIG